MLHFRIRIRNRLLQAFYRPQLSRRGLLALPAQTLSIFDEIENGIEKNITPLLSDFFN